MRNATEALMHEEGLSKAEKKALSVLRDGGYKPVLYKVKNLKGIFLVRTPDGRGDFRYSIRRTPNGNNIDDPSAEVAFIEYANLSWEKTQTVFVNEGGSK